MRLRLTIAIEGVDFDPEGARLPGWPFLHSAALCLHTSDSAGGVCLLSLANIKLRYRLIQALRDASC